MATNSTYLAQPKYKHLLIIRTSALGDVAMLPHVVRAFKEAYPKVKVSILTKQFLRPLFDGLDVNFIFLDDKKRKIGEFANLWRVAGEIKRAGVDAIADVHGVHRSSILRILCAIRGFIPSHAIDKGRVEKWFRMGYSRATAVPLKHSVIRYCDVIRSFGFEFDAPKPAKRQIFENPMGVKRGRWIGFAPFSAHEGKTYPEGMREELVGLLAERFDEVFIHSGAGDEAAFAEAMEKKYENVTALWRRLPFNEERDLISNLDCVITMDSLVMHLAALVATPTVSVWGATHPELGFTGYGSDSRGILQEEMPCRPCSVYGKKSCKTGDYKCIKAITPQRIIERVEEMLAQTNADEAKDEPKAE